MALKSIETRHKLQDYADEAANKTYNDYLADD
jgi:hypothetical protein